MIFGLQRRMAQRHAADCTAALVEILEFVTNELDPEPAPWPAYFTTKKSQRLAAVLQAHRDPS